MTDLELVTQRLDGFGETLDRLEAHAVKAEQRFDRLEAHAVTVDERLDSIEDNMATKMELARTRASLEQGQDLLLRVVRGQTEQLGRIPPALSELDRRVSALESLVGKDR